MNRLKITNLFRCQNCKIQFTILSQCAECKFCSYCCQEKKVCKNPCQNKNCADSNSHKECDYCSMCGECCDDVGCQVECKGCQDKELEIIAPLELKNKELKNLVMKLKIELNKYKKMNRKNKDYY